jgi:hypothetical protein
MPESGAVSPPAWEASPWVPEDRTVEEPRSPREEPLRLSEEHVIDSVLASESIVRDH